MRGPCWTLDSAFEGIGPAFPQHQEMGKGLDYYAADSVHQLPHDKIPDFEPNFNTVVIHGHAKLTVMLSSAPIKNTGFLESSRFRAVLEDFVLPSHHFYPVPATYRKTRPPDIFGSNCPSRNCHRTRDHRWNRPKR